MATAVLLFISSGVSPVSASSLQWGHPQLVDKASEAEDSPQPAPVVHDPQVVAAAWADADSSLSENDLPDVEYVADGRSVVVKRSTRIDEPETVEQSSPAQRFAQLPDDPFETDFSDESSEEMPEPEIDDVEGAVQDEIDRRDGAGAYDVFDDPTLNEPTSEKSLEGKSPLEDGADVDATPTVEDDDTSLEPADTRLFDEMTSGEEAPERETTDEATQYGRENLDLNLPQPANDELTEEQRRLLEEEREENRTSCQEELEKLRGQTLESIDLSIRVPGNAGEDYPFECSLEGEQLAPREWPQITYMWKAAGLCHKPLYFEQVALERYGHSWGPYTQPIMSGIHFFGTLPILPYEMGLKTPNECVYTLGYYRPGNCAPYLVGGVPFTWRAAAYEMGAATGISFTIP